MRTIDWAQHVRRFGEAWCSYPGRWLAAAFLLTMSAYAARGVEALEAWPWIVLDLFLFWRVLRGGRSSLTVLVVLTAVAVALGVLGEVGEALAPGVIDSGATWPVLLLMVSALVCLLSPALDPDADPFGRAGTRCAPVR